MRTDQKNQINEMRKRGCTYANIAETLSVSENTIKTYCRRTRLTEDSAKAVLVCKQCGKPSRRRINIEHGNSVLTSAARHGGTPTVAVSPEHNTT